MSNYDLLADLREWAESYDAVEIGADGVLYNAINRIEALEEALRLADAALGGANMNMDVVQKKVRAALGEKKDD